jgi:hypothetical protein
MISKEEVNAVIKATEKARQNAPKLSRDLGQRFEAFSKMVVDSIEAAAANSDSHPVKGLALVQCLNTETGKFVPCLGLQFDEGNGERSKLAIVGPFLSLEESAHYVPVSAEKAASLFDPGDLSFDRDEGTVH